MAAQRDCKIVMRRCKIHRDQALPWRTLVETDNYFHVIVAIILTRIIHGTIILDTLSSFDIPVNGITSAVQAVIHAIGECVECRRKHTPEWIAGKPIACDNYAPGGPGDANVVRCASGLAVVVSVRGA
jgi:hypothetical protein